MIKVFDLGKQYIKDNTIVIDAGSNLVKWVYFSQKLKKSSIYSFEATLYFKILKKYTNK